MLHFEMNEELEANLPGTQRMIDALAGKTSTEGRQNATRRGTKLSYDVFSLATEDQMSKMEDINEDICSMVNTCKNSASLSNL